MATSHAAKPAVAPLAASSRGGRALALGALAWALSLQFFLMQAAVQSAWTTPFSLKHNFISDLGNTVCAPYPPGSQQFVCSPWHAAMNASFILLGLLMTAGAVLARRAFPRGWMATLGLGLVALAGPGLVLVGLFPENESIRPHFAGATLQFVSGNLGLIVLGAALARAGGRRATAAATVAAGFAGLVATVLFVEEAYLGIGIGGMERVAVYPLPLWLTVAGTYLLRSKR